MNCPAMGALALTIMLVNFAQAEVPLGTESDPIVDSNMSEKEIFDGLPDDCPDSIRRNQAVVEVVYYSFDDKYHQGQIVVDRRLADDIRSVFSVARMHRFPIQSVIPMSHQQFRADGRWSDELSMNANNTSGFNYRKIAGTDRLSFHATGQAMDINPLLNPYIKADTVLPAKATYDPSKPGTLHGDHPVVREFLRLGWDWGGNWRSLKDYQHFEKALNDD